MKNKSKKFLTTLAIISSTFALTGCFDSSNSTSKPAASNSVVSKTSEKKEDTTSTKPSSDSAKSDTTSTDSSKKSDTTTIDKSDTSIAKKTGTVTLNFDSSKGTVTADKESGDVGDTITLTVTANDGFVVKEVKANDTVLTGPTYSFVLVEGVNTVEVTFKVALPEGATEIKYCSEADLGADTWSYWYADWEAACTVNAAYKTSDGTIHFDFSNTMEEKTSWHHQMFYKDSNLAAGKYKMTAKINSTVAGDITLNNSQITLVAGENDIDITYNHTTAGGTSFSLQCSFLGTAVLDISNITYTAIKDELPEGATKMVWATEQDLTADTWTYWNANWEGGHVVNKAYVTQDGTVHFDFNDTNPYEYWLEQIFYKDSSLQVGSKYTFKSVINSTVAGEIIVNGQTINLVAGDNNIEVDFTQSAASSLCMQLAKLGTAVIEIKNPKFEAYTAKGTITEGELPEGVFLSYKIGEDDASLNTKYAVGTEVTVTLTDTTDTVEDVLVNSASIKTENGYKFTIVEGTNNVTVKLKGQTVTTKDLPIIEKGNQSTKIEGAGIWIYLDNTDLGITAANASEFNVVAEVTCKTSAGSDFEVNVTNKEFNDYGKNTVRLYILLDKGPGADFKTTVKITMTHGSDVYEKTTSFTGSAWDEASKAVEPTTYTDVYALATGASDTRFEGAGAWIWVSTESLNMTSENSGNYSVISTEVSMKNDAGGDTGATGSSFLSDHNFTEKYFRIYVVCNMAPVDGWTTTISVKLSDGNGVGYKVTCNFSGTSYVTNTTAA